MFENIDAEEYKRLHGITIKMIRRFPDNVGIDPHDLAHEALEFFYSIPNRTSLRLCVIDALRKRHGRTTVSSYLDEMEDYKAHYIDKSFAEIDAHKSIASLYGIKRGQLTDSEKKVFLALIADQSMAELAREDGYTESYFSYKKKDLIRKLRAAI